MELVLNHKLFSGKKLLTLARFIITGFIGLLIDFSVTWLCKEHLGLNRYVSNGLGFSIAVINNYILNRIWTFKNKQKNIIQQFGRFFLISLIGLGISTLFLFFIHTQLNINFYVSKAVVVIVVFIWNYSANTMITFKKSEL